MIGLLFFSTTIIFAKYKPASPINKKYKTLAEKKDLFKKVGCRYSTVLDINFSDFEILKKSNDYLQAKKNYKNKSQKYHLEVKKKIQAPLYLAWISDTVGYGVFAETDIKKDDFIGEYFGTLRPIKKGADNLDYSWCYTLYSFHNQNIIIDAKDQGNEMRFVNHSSHPNTIRIDVIDDHDIFHICYIANKDIAKDEQLTISYGEEYFTSREMPIIEVATIMLH